MGVRDKMQMTKGAALFVGIMALLFLANNVWGLFEGGPRNLVLVWIAIAVDIALLGYAVWGYRQAAKRATKQK